MRSESSKSSSEDTVNAIDHINKQACRDSRLGVYCTLRSRNNAAAADTAMRKSSTDSRIGEDDDNEKNHFPPPQHDGQRIEFSLHDNRKINVEDYCTVGRQPPRRRLKVKRPIKQNLLDSEIFYSEFHNASSDDVASGITNFGLSNDLSSESIKNACDSIDFSDEDAVNVTEDSGKSTTVSSGFQNVLLDSPISCLKRSSSVRSPTRSIAFDRKLRPNNHQFHPYCTIRREKCQQQKLPSKNDPTESYLNPSLSTTDQARSSQQQQSWNDDSIEALNILSELDAILDNHETLESTSPLTISLPESPSTASAVEAADYDDEDSVKVVDDYLLELDTYLDHIDRISTACENDEGQDKSLTIERAKIISRMANTLPKRPIAKTMTKTTKVQPLNGIFLVKHSHYDEEDNRKNQTLLRGHNFRNTIAAAAPSTDHNGGDHASDFRDISSSHRHRLWRRYSMRKTSPIILPISQIENQASHSTNNAIITTDPKGKVKNSIQSDSQLKPINSSSEIQVEFPSTLDQQVTLSESIIPTITNSENRLSNQTHSTENRENLTPTDIINDILNSSTEYSASSERQQRPRQFGRRSETNPRVVSIMAERNHLSGSQRIVINHARPMSAPVATNRRSTITSSPTPTSMCNSSRYVGSEPSSVGSSRNPSPVSIVSSTASSSMASAGPDPPPENPSNNRQRSSPADDSNEVNSEDTGSRKEPQWPHGFSRTLAILCCTLGLFNISRFSVYSIHYGANFLVQFLILSILFGVPLLWLQMCLGAKIKSGPVSMWKISPICKGVGISLMIAQCFTALYTAISLGWMIVYFKDSFVSRGDRYRWQEPFELYRGPGNSTNNLAESVADYFNGVVLQRLQLGPAGRVGSGGVRFQLAFNLAILWTMVFVILCRGLKSFGKIALGLTLIPLLLFICVCSKLLSMIDFSSVQNIFPATDWPDFFLNSRSWLSAAQETFLTWGFLGASVIAMSCRSAEKCEGKTILRRDAVLVVVLTFFGLFMAAVFGNACVQILQNNGYLYFPGSYENIDTYLFLYPIQHSIPPHFISTPPKWLPRYSTILGEYFRRPGMNPLRESGFQALRLATEIFPATLAAATQEFISPVWSLMGYLTLFLFGLAQLCAMWRPISSILGESTSSVLLSCVTGLLLGFPFASEMGLAIIHYLDVVIGGAWWILILWATLIFAVFLIRGRPYNGDILVNDLRMTQTLSAFLALSWNVLLPIGLITLSVIEYKASNTREFYHWKGNSYFHLWTRKIGGFIQIGFLLLIPLTAIVQIYRYLSSGPPDILDRIQLLYRPSQTPLPHRRNRPYDRAGNASTQPTTATNLSSMESQPAAQDDAPPKYTPPPSYTTATGARLAKLLRQSIRRSVRRILGEPSRSRPAIRRNSQESSLPPAYSTVLTDPSGEEIEPEHGPRPLYNSNTNRSLSLERQRPVPTISFSNHPDAASSGNIRGRSAQTFSAFDVAQLLRSNSRHERSASSIGTCVDHVFKSTSLRTKQHSRSVENLVLNAAPLGESSIITLNSSYVGSRDENENTSVI